VKIDIMDFQQKRAWTAQVSREWCEKNYCDHAVSIGYVLGEDIRQSQLDYLLSHGKVEEVSYAGAIGTQRAW
jgi:hypothetical protein